MLVLYLDSALQKCSVAVADGSKIIGTMEAERSNSAAEELNVLIKDCLQSAGLSLKDVKAVCISRGPGSYTGLRIGMSVAKGICFALDVPLFAVNTLEMMVNGAVSRYAKSGYELYVPMIDARRMEVFTAVYRAEKNNIRCIDAPHPLLIDESSYQRHNGKKTLFFGSGAEKARDILRLEKGEYWLDYQPHAADLVMKEGFFNSKKEIKDLAYLEPEYLKDYHFK